MTKDVTRFEKSTKWPSPKPSNFSKKEITELAKDIRNRFKFLPGTSDLVEFVSRLGGRIDYQDFDNDSKSGTLTVHDYGNFEIILPNCTTVERDNFTIAHELGHYFIHGLAMDMNRFRAYRGRSERLEWEANWFAAEFLMPEEMIREMKKSGLDFYRIASILNVSPAAARVRLETI